MSDPRTGFLVEVLMYTEDARKALSHPEVLREAFGLALERLGLMEEVDVTITVDRSMPVIRGVSV